ncbi:MAG TPA: NUDIX hydrolase [Allosphingosinicella sp.]|jgi:8-oxo-dGTP pyrophosphatase MutT (NUDIX family)
MPEPLPEPIPAATLILMRPAAAGGAPEILMMERAQTMAFAAGALVFPGGRIEEADEAFARTAFPHVEDGAERIAAVRETIEETGIAAAVRPQPDAELVAGLRAQLADGAPLAGLLEARGLTLDLEALTPFARWCPNFREARRFDTFFYLAEAPPGAGVTSADQTEAVRAFWASAADVIRDIEAGQAHAIFPTRRNLERLAQFASIEDARGDAARHPVRKITPWVEERDGRRFVVIPEDAGYPVTAEAYETARRR